MRSTTFHNALIAAARVAGCAALIACRPPMDDRYVTDTADPGGVVSGDTADAPLDTAPVSDSSTSPETDGECEAFLDTSFEGWDWEQPIEPFKSDETIVGCCEQLGATADGDSSWDFPHRDPCCSILDWQGPIACTPWGPPRPPAMPSMA